jgi:hypothetical protein
MIYLTHHCFASRIKLYLMKKLILPRFFVSLISAFLVLPLAAFAQAPQPDEAAIIRGVDAAVKARVDSIAGYTVTEHYAVYRNNDETHPAAEMTVKTTYRQESGKSYEILSETGSSLLQKMVLHPILDEEKRINEPGNREASWITSANYEMKLKPGSPQPMDGRICYAIAINPKVKAHNLIIGTLWVDSKDETIVRLEGTASKSVSVFTGPAQVMRQYVNIDGFGQATHARAVSDSTLFGQTVVTIDYRDYSIQLRAAH